MARFDGDPKVGVGIMPSGDSMNIVRFDMNVNMLFVMHQRKRVFQMSLKPDSMTKLPNNQIGFQWIPTYFKIYFQGFMIFDIHINQLQISDNLKHKLKTGDVLPVISSCIQKRTQHADPNHPT
eukprot:168299_1